MLVYFVSTISCGKRKLEKKNCVSDQTWSIATGAFPSGGDYQHLARGGGYAPPPPPPVTSEAGADYRIYESGFMAEAGPPQYLAPQLSQPRTQSYLVSCIFSLEVKFHSGSVYGDWE